ncbi:MAG: adenylate/guanylate cyclase domain-containing protein [Alphaproteobacteria bacterium]|nr:MAG: adenylate/guanylate cyclase domain-containing protein [Alphaproteobacteria bacterium]
MTRAVALWCAALAVAAAVFSWLPLVRDGTAGASIDLALALRYHLGLEPPPRPARATVIAIDEATFASTRLSGVPTVAWGPEFGAVIDKAIAAGAAVVGLDVILPTSIERYAPNHDRPLRQALARARRAGERVVLTQVQLQDQPLGPHASLVRVVGPENVRWATLDPDRDGIVRRAPLWIARTDGQQDPSLALDLAARAGGTPPIRAGATTNLGPHAVEGESVLLDLRGGGFDVATHSFIDILECEDPAFLARAFANQVVLIGLVVDVEDRKLTSKRWITAPEGAASAESCTGQPLVAQRFARAEVAGVQVHAAAVETLLAGTAPQVISPVTSAGTHGLVAGAITACLLLLATPLAAAMITLIAVALVLATALAAGQGVILPLASLIATVALVLVAASVVRIGVMDRDKRTLRRMFELYLSQQLVDRLVASGRMPELGGERREMTVLFTDLEGFTGLLESVDPLDVTPVLLEYLTGIADCVMRHGGYVNEFIGDAVLAFFGAPMGDDNHRTQAMAAARAIDAFAEAFRQHHQIGGRNLGVTRIGLHTGVAVVGNFGSRQRLKYSAMGDTVNTASRLEGLNKHLGTRCIVSATVLEGTEETSHRPLARVVLKGRRDPLLVCELLPEGQAADQWTAIWHRLDAGDPAAAEALLRAFPSDLVAQRLTSTNAATHLIMTEK